jgi:hypothetical protein
MYSKRYIIILVAILVSGCSNSASNGVASGVLMPLTYDNNWTYGGVSTDSVTGKSYFTDTVTDSVKYTMFSINSLWSAVISTNDSEIGFPRRLYRNAADGLPYSDAGSNFDNLIAKYPANVGDAFQDSLVVTDESSPTPRDTAMTMYVLGTNETVTVPAGSFQCMKYGFAPFGGQSFLYYAPGVGLIEDSDSSGRNKLVLLTPLALELEPNCLLRLLAAPLSTNRL